ncbi:MAG TPA: hypothetical protein VFL54_08750 [Gammaproteobacteria bacterium]|jgi:hypothetical protein|nr:hypothetical protein [Gammaproteobacteria bacterium]
MNGGEIMVLGIVIVVMASAIIRHYLRVRETEMRDHPQSNARLESLEERVRTLERIVTDRGYDLKREFDKL